MTRYYEDQRDEAPAAPDITGGLRTLASRLENGEFPSTKFVTVLIVDPNARFRAFAFGECTVLETLGAHARAVARDLVDEQED